MRYRSLLFLLCMQSISAYHLAWGQDLPSALGKVDQTRLVRLRSITGVESRGTDPRIAGDSLALLASDGPRRMALATLQSVEVQRSYATTGALLGTLAGLAPALVWANHDCICTAQFPCDRNLTDAENASQSRCMTTRTLVSVVGTALIGGVVGQAVRTWRTVWKRH